MWAVVLVPARVDQMLPGPAGRRSHLLCQAWWATRAGPEDRGALGVPEVLDVPEDRVALGAPEVLVVLEDRAESVASVMLAVPVVQVVPAALAVPEVRVGLEVQAV